jgi:hypothetical protein
VGAPHAVARPRLTTMTLTKVHTTIVSANRGAARSVANCPTSPPGGSVHLPKSRYSGPVDQTLVLGSERLFPLTSLDNWY